MIVEIVTKVQKFEIQSSVLRQWLFAGGVHTPTKPLGNSALDYLNLWLHLKMKMDEFSTSLEKFFLLNSVPKLIDHHFGLIPCD